MTTKTKSKAKAKPVTLAKWQADQALTDAEAAKRLGLARNSFTKYRDGEAPLTVRLAVAALAAGLSA